MIIAIHGKWPNEVTVISACPIGAHGRTRPEALKRVRRHAAIYLEQFRVDGATMRIVELVPDEEPFRFYQRQAFDVRRKLHPEAMTIEFATQESWQARRVNGAAAIIRQVEVAAHEEYKDGHRQTRSALHYDKREYGSVAIANLVNDTQAKAEQLQNQLGAEAIIAKLRWIARNPRDKNGDALCDPEKVRWAQMLVNKL